MKNFTFILLISLFLFASPAFPQTIGIGGGLSTLQGPDEYINDIYSGGLRFSSGYHIGAKLKFRIPLSSITLAGSATFSKFSSNGSTHHGNLKISQSVWTIAAGAEYELIQGPITPYVAADLGYSDFGEADVEGIYPLLQPLPVKRGSGYGIAVGIGSDFIILPGIGLDASVKYNFFDLIAKKWEKEPLSVLSYDLTILF